jgi:hypothetical protein
MSTTAQGPSVPPAQVDDVLDALAPFHVALPCRAETRAYLERHPDGLSLVVPIAAGARQEFPDPAELSLEVYADPETGEQDLKLYVRLERYEPGIWQRLLNVCDPFEEEFARMSSGWPHVTTDYRPPHA